MHVKGAFYAEASFGAHSLLAKSNVEVEIAFSGFNREREIRIDMLKRVSLIHFPKQFSSFDPKWKQI